VTDTHHTICRACHAGCGVLVELEDGEPVAVKGDPDDPLFRGFCCIKGQNFHNTRSSPQRLLHSQKRQADGSYMNIPIARAMDEIATKLQTLIESNGARALATYSGTMAANASAANGAMSSAWLKATGSRMGFNSNTIDQPGKMVAAALHGRWMAPSNNFAEANVVLLIGANPLVSMSGGIPHTNPGRSLTDALNAGLKLIVIDPRRSETARRADLHLQSIPGQDIALLAALLHTIINEERYDKAFVDEEVEGLVALRDAVAPFAPAAVATRVGVDAAQIEAAARMFASASKGVVTAGTGPNMSGNTTLLEYLILAINTVCGRWQRAGEHVHEPATLGQPTYAKAQAIAPYPDYAYNFGERIRVRNLSNTAAGLPTAALADEIIMPGAGQVKALISHGGNPVAAWPDQLKTIEAMQTLELLVQIDVTMSATAKMADYVIAVKHPLETPGTSLAQEYLSGYAVGFGATAAYANYTPAIVPVPDGSDLIEDWEFFYGLAQRMNLDLTLKPISFNGTVRVQGHQLDMHNPPSSDALLNMLTQGSRIPLAQVRRASGGTLYPDPVVKVLPKDPDCSARLDIGNAQMMQDLAEQLVEADNEQGYPLRMVSRRQINVLNSTGMGIPAQTHGKTYNPAYMHSADIDALGLKEGQTVAITSARASIRGVIAKDDNLRRGLLSMTHCWGGRPEEDDDYAHIGANTGRLSSVEIDYEKYTGMPRMSNIPVKVSALD
jgi:anaerobic selenocysteine-containing dehydrogenase